MIFLLLIYASIFAINAPGLIKRKERKEFAVFLIFYAIAFARG